MNKLNCSAENLHIGKSLDELLKKILDLISERITTDIPGGILNIQMSGLEILYDGNSPQIISIVMGNGESIMFRIIGKKSARTARMMRVEISSLSRTYKGFMADDVLQERYDEYSEEAEENCRRMISEIEAILDGSKNNLVVRTSQSSITSTLLYTDKQ